MMSYKFSLDTVSCSIFLLFFAFPIPRFFFYFQSKQDLTCHIMSYIYTFWLLKLFVSIHKIEFPYSLTNNLSLIHI